jgi:cold shock CspA family protein
MLSSFRTFVPLQAPNPVPHRIIEVDLAEHSRSGGFLCMEEIMPYSMARRYNAHKGYGFIQSDDGSIERGEEGKTTAVNLELNEVAKNQSVPVSMLSTAELRQIVMEIMG